MKIIQLTAENVKKLTAVEIKPDGNMVQIAGKNGQGKTSVLDAIWWALAGTEGIQKQPIRNGADKARIELTLGTGGKTELVVERRITEKSSSLTVKNAEGFKASSPQQMLNDLLGALTFDPLGFMRQDGKKQFDVLRGLVKLDVDLEELDRANKADFAKRTDINRNAKNARAAAEAIQVPEGLPESRVDADALLGKLTEAAQINSDIERRKANRERAMRDIANNEALIAETEKQLPGSISEIRAARDAHVAKLEQQIAALKSEIDEKKASAEKSIETCKDIAAATIKKLSDANAEIKTALDAAGDLPAPVDVGELRKQVDEANATNKAIEMRERRDAYLKQATDAESESEKLTEAMKAREQQKIDAIGKVEMPVPGLGFGDGIVTYNGLPLDQASDAEQLMVSTAIAAALNPKLRVIRIRDGSLLDDDAMKRLAAFADERDFQIWIERVDGSGTVGIVMEDGHVKGQEIVAQAAE